MTSADLQRKRLERGGWRLRPSRLGGHKPDAWCHDDDHLRPRTADEAEALEAARQRVSRPMFAGSCWAVGVNGQACWVAGLKDLVCKAHTLWRPAAERLRNEVAR